MRLLRSTAEIRQAAATWLRSVFTREEQRDKARVGGLTILLMGTIAASPAELHINTQHYFSIQSAYSSLFLGVGGGDCALSDGDVFRVDQAQLRPDSEWFRLDYVPGYDYYGIHVASSDKMMEPKDDSNQDGSPIYQRVGQPNAAGGFQDWRIKLKFNPTSVTIENVGSGRVLDIPIGTTTPVQIQQFIPTDGLNQRWILRDSDVTVRESPLDKWLRGPTQKIERLRVPVRPPNPQSQFEYTFDADPGTRIWTANAVIEPPGNSSECQGHGYISARAVVLGERQVKMTVNDCVYVNDFDKGFWLRPELYTHAEYCERQLDEPLWPGRPLAIRTEP
jgi:Ricin-type beta-trefoil lectin domain-like